MPRNIFHKYFSVSKEYVYAVTVYVSRNVQRDLYRFFSFICLNILKPIWQEQHRAKFPKIEACFLFRDSDLLH